MDISTVFCTNLKKYIKESKIPQHRIAQKMGVATSTVSRWLAGEAWPSPESVDKLSIILNTNSQNFYLNQGNDNLISTPKNISESLILLSKIKDWKRFSSFMSDYINNQDSSADDMLEELSQEYLSNDEIIKKA